MKLLRFRITNYKSIRDSGPIDVSEITCLVGKNESGKTSLLQALYKLNPVQSSHGDFDVTDEYPRVDVEDYNQKVEDGEIQPANVVEATYLLEAADIAAAESQFGVGVVKSAEFTLSRGYENTLRVSLDVDASIAIKAIVGARNLPEPVAASAAKQGSLASLWSFLESDGKDRQVRHANAMATAQAKSDPDEKTKALADAAQIAESNAAKTLKESISKIVKTPLSIHIWSQVFETRWPKFLYFDEYYQMEGHVNIEKLRERQAAKTPKHSDHAMLGLIELARLDLDQLLKSDRTEELVNKLEGASNHLSNQILKYWSQNKHLRVKFDVRPGRSNDPDGMRSGTNLWGRVVDTVHSVSTQLGSRSKGFLWFFSFLAWFGKQKKSKEPLILLLDEPGLFLHAKAQGDLLKYMDDDLRGRHQVVYTTHSPFMIDPRSFERVRIVEDRSIDTIDDNDSASTGTKVFKDVLEANEGSLFPLQGALGYDIAQTLFVGPNCLLVEGVSDLLYLQTINAILAQQGRTCLDERWTITPVGGADKIPTFAALLGAQRHLTIATLIDFQAKDRQNIENLYKRKLLQKSHVLTYAEFSNRVEADVEDMFEPSFMVRLVNAEFASELHRKVVLKDIESGDPRVVRRLESHFSSDPIKGGARFNHFRPARYFAQYAEKMKPQLADETLRRFESAFARLNEILARR